METERKKCSDQEDKEGEQSFSYQGLVAVPPVFSSLRVCFLESFIEFSTVEPNFIERGEIRSGKKQKGRPIIELLVILPLVKRFAYALVND